jgi:alcohol dehydrogenase class IV
MEVIMNNFTFFLNTIIDFGRNSSKNLSKYINEYNCKDVLIVIDKNLINLGMLKPFVNQLNECGVSYRVFDEVNPNPEVHNIDQGAAFNRSGKCDLIIAIGGGSTIDTAKGISVMSVNSGSIYDYLDGRLEEKKEIVNDPIPIIAIPTTAGTGSEVSMYSVITDEKSRIKDSLTSPKIYPKVAIVDPILPMKLPPHITAFTGLDVLGHALEAYTSTIHNPLTDVWALEAIKLVFDNLPCAVKKSTEESRDNMAFASLMAGSAMSHCGATIPHGLGCPLSGHLGLPHGLTVGILQVPMIKYNREVLKDEFYRIVKYIEPNSNIKENEAADRLIELIKDLLKQIGVKETIDKDKLDEDTLKSMIDDAKIHGSTSLNKLPLTVDDIHKLYSEIFN